MIVEISVDAGLVGKVRCVVPTAILGSLGKWEGKTGECEALGPASLMCTVQNNSETLSQTRWQVRPDS